MKRYFQHLIPIALMTFVSVVLTMPLASCDDRANSIVEDMKIAQKVEESQKDEATKQVRATVARHLNMSDGEKRALSISIHGIGNAWAWIEAPSGLKLLCRHDKGTWNILSMGTDPKLPEDTPIGLIQQASQKR